MKKLVSVIMILCMLLTVAAAQADGLTSMRAAKTQIVVTEGYTAAVEVLPTPADASMNLVWESSDRSIATVDADGVITGVCEGNCNVIATDVTGRRISVQVRVEPVIAMTATPVAYYGTSSDARTTVVLKVVTKAAKLRGYGLKWVYLNADREVITGTYEYLRYNSYEYSTISGEDLVESSDLFRPGRKMTQQLHTNVVSPSYFVLYFTHFMMEDGEIHQLTKEMQHPMVYSIHNNKVIEGPEADAFLAGVNLSGLDLTTKAGTSTVN